MVIEEDVRVEEVKEEEVEVVVAALARSSNGYHQLKVEVEPRVTWGLTRVLVAVVRRGTQVVALVGVVENVEDRPQLGVGST